MINKIYEKAVLTLATGKPIYIQMAINLARSFKWWHKHSSIRFVLATDQKQLIPPDLQDIEIIELQPGQYGQGFSPKLHLDKLAPAAKTLFVDADCLCVGSLESVFDRFANRAVSVVGTTISEGEWFGNVAAICERFAVTALPKFNGGVYYMEKGEISDRVYATARELEPQYDEIGLLRLRDRPNDELLMAIAMALHNCTPIPDDGSILSDPQACPGGVFLDVLRGGSRLINPPPPNPLHQPWYPFTEVNPVLVHFLGHHATVYPYKREELRLAFTARNWSMLAADAAANLLYSTPYLSKTALKKALRPAYRQLFGVRAIPSSSRL